MLHAAARLTGDPTRRLAIGDQAALILADTQREIAQPGDVAAVRAAYAELLDAIELASDTSSTRSVGN